MNSECEKKGLTNGRREAICRPPIEADTLLLPVTQAQRGGHRSILNMNAVLNESKIELPALSRPLICEPDLPHRWQSGNTTPSRCVSCNNNLVI